MSSLSVNSINKIFPSGTPALYDVNFNADDKEFLVILGAEGSGKSTLLRVICGLDEPSSGTISVDGKNVTEEDPKDRNMAMVFRGDSLYKALTVYDNMEFGLKLRKAPQVLREQRVKATAKILGLESLLYRKPKSLTAEQRQRVAIARAIVREPRLYLFDEPLSNFDENLQAEMLDLIINLQARMQGTFVYATSDLSTALTIGTRIIVLKNGMIQQIDSPKNLYDYPANAYVAFYIGAPTINFAQNSKIIKDENGYSVVFGNCKVALPENILSRFTDIEKYADTEKAVILGVRPEDIKVLRTGEGLPANVSAVESDGGVTYAECNLGGGNSFIGVMPEGVNAVKGDGVNLAVDWQRLHLFDGETRLTLLSRDGGYIKTGYPDSDFKPMSYIEEQAIIEKHAPKKEGKVKKLR